MTNGVALYRGLPRWREARLVKGQLVVLGALQLEDLSALKMGFGTVRSTLPCSTVLFAVQRDFFLSKLLCIPGTEETFLFVMVHVLLFECVYQAIIVEHPIADPPTPHPLDALFRALWITQLDDRSWNQFSPKFWTAAHRSIPAPCIESCNRYPPSPLV